MRKTICFPHFFSMKQFFTYPSLLFVFLFVFSFSSKAFSARSDLFFYDSYFLPQNDVQLSLNADFISTSNAVLNGYTFRAEYGVSEKLKLSIFVPYFKYWNSGDGGILGDLAAEFKFLALSSDNLEWKVSGSFYFKFATGVTESDASRVVNRQDVSYFPFSTGSSQFSPTVTYSRFVGDFLINGTFSYKIENETGDTMFTFYAPYDRIDLQLSADYFFKLFEGEKSTDYLGVRPALYLGYLADVSSGSYFGSSFYLCAECNLKWKEKLRIRLHFEAPLWAEQDDYRYSFGTGLSFVL